MRIMVVHPGSPYSTSDVYDGLCWGLRSNGAEVLEARLDHGLAFFGDCLDAVLQANADYPLPEWGKDPSALAGARIVSAAAILRPDHAIVVTGLKLHYSVPAAFHALGIPATLLCTETPYDPDERKIAPIYRHVFTHEKAGLPLFAPHPSAHFLPHAYHPERHTPGPAEREKTADVYFVGAGFEERRPLLHALASELGAGLVCHGVLWDEGVDYRDERAVWGGVTPNEEAVRWYRSASICLNHHRTTTVYGSGQHIAPGSAVSLGPRTFELAACRAFQLCDDSRPDLPELFGDCVPTYRADDPADLLRQVRHYLARPDARARLAAEQHEAVAQHHWGNRAKQLLERIT
jgi:spore maturation protein CgeB